MELCDKIASIAIFLGCGVGELVSRIVMMDRFKTNQQEFSDSLELQAITTSSLSFQIWHVKC